MPVYPCGKCSAPVPEGEHCGTTEYLCSDCYGAKFKSVDDLWATVDEQHEALDEGNEEAGPAVAILRKACLDFLKETDPTNKG